MKPVLFTRNYLAQCFSESYAEAQQKFKQLVHCQSGQDSCREFVYPQSGPSGEKLLTTVTWSGDTDAPCILVLQSATHGVEGFAGSAIQLDTLHRLANNALPEGVAVLFIHVLNPYGFAWLRRVNEDGVDLNRNFVDFSLPLPVNSGYMQLADQILPAKPGDWDSATQALDDYAIEYGRQALEMAVSGGQYQFPDGLFYGGARPTQSRLYLERIISEYDLAGRHRVAVIDIHSGLGPFGYGEVICDHPPGSTGVTLARQWYGSSVTEPALGNSASVTKLGLVDYLWQQKLGEHVCFVTLEFGTYTVDEMFEVLRRDHLLHRQDIEWSAAETQQVKRSIRRFFYPDTDDWKEIVLMRGRQCVRQALQGLGGAV